MKKFFKIMLSIFLVLLTFLVFHSLNHYFPKNIISRTIRGLSVVLTPVLIALVILYLVNPMTQRMINTKKISKKAAISITLIVVIVVLLAIFAFAGWFLFKQGKILYDTVTDPHFIESIKIWLYDHGLGSFYEWANDFFENINLKDYIGSVNSFLTVVLQTLAAIILVPIFLWHLLNNQEVIAEKLQDNIPVSWRKNVIPILNDSNDVIVSYFRSKLLSMVILFFMFSILYLSLGLPLEFVFLFAVIISLLDLIPYLGPTVGLLLPMVYILSTGGVNLFYINSWHVNALVANIILLLVNFLIQFIQGNIIVPKLAGKEMHINSAVILVFMLFFGYILGVWGIVLSIPLGGILFVLWKHFKETGFFQSETHNNNENNIDE